MPPKFEGTCKAPDYFLQEFHADLAAVLEGWSLESV
jgi:hypothetical protein